MPRRLDYPAAVAALRSRGRFGISLGLERVDAILDRLDRPDRRLRGALIAGTNGKGSVVALVRATLNAAGLRVGTMPKPHLVSYRERIAVDGEPLSEAAFADAVERVLPAVDDVAERLGPPTEFEVLTAAAFAELARAEVDLAVVEVGMGGRLDATNVLDPGVAAVTNVALDHERYLGHTLAAIGTEKAAIIKAENLAVTGASGRGLRPILDRCADLAVPLRRAGPRQPYRASVRDAGWDGLVLDARAGARELDELHLALLGSHQAGNAAVALAVLDALGQDGERRGSLLGVDDGAIRRGFATVRWPGRMELLRSTSVGPVLLDGAHNPAGARALAAALDELGLRRFPLVFGAMRGKRVSAVLRALAPLRPRPVFADVPDRGAHTAGELLHAWRPIGRGGRAEPVLERALAEAAALRRGADQPVVVAGSLYLVGAVRGMLLGERSEA
ncbi:MAG TPA: Mur ligase family protein [Candidatus Limnocylindria bacterium]|nr:Mur ligase family protein [Candidatus Limnocylindria bacterium]